MMFSVSFFISYCVQSAVHVGHDAGDAVAELRTFLRTRNQAQIDVKVSAGVGRGS